MIFLRNIIYQCTFVGLSMIACATIYAQASPQQGGRAAKLGAHSNLTQDWISYTSRIQAQILPKDMKHYNAIPTRSQLDALPPVKGDKELQCLTEALYFEARGETIPGIFAVAEVIINRRDHKKFPDTICKVISQGETLGLNSCQFSYKCDGLREEFYNKSAHKLVGKIAKIALDNRVPLLTDKALYYHADFVSPSWAKKFQNTAIIGDHLFYRG